MPRHRQSAPAAASRQATPEAQLRTFIARFAPKDQALIRSVRKAVRQRLPAANEMVYDNYNFFVIGYSPTERPSDAVVSIAAGASGVGLCFIHGARLPDPDGILLGSGKQTRFIRLESAAVLKRPAVQALIAAAIARSKRWPSARERNARGGQDARGRLIIRSVSAKQRPRRKPARSRPASRAMNA
jgi:hypothetical protein